MTDNIIPKTEIANLPAVLPIFGESDQSTQEFKAPTLYQPKQFQTLTKAERLELFKHGHAQCVAHGTYAMAYAYNLGSLLKAMDKEEEKGLVETLNLDKSTISNYKLVFDYWQPTVKRLGRAPSNKEECRITKLGKTDQVNNSAKQIKALGIKLVLEKAKEKGITLNDKGKDGLQRILQPLILSWRKWITLSNDLNEEMLETARVKLYELVIDCANDTSIRDRFLKASKRGTKPGSKPAAPKEAAHKPGNNKPGTKGGV